MPQAMPPLSRDFLQALPKCEHHMHLEGALRPLLLFDLASKNAIALPHHDPAFSSPDALLSRYQRFASLDDFLHYYYIAMSVLVTASDYEALAWDYFEHAHRDGVVHAELFFDPQAHVSRGVSYGTVVQGFMRARRRAEAELGISSLLTACFLRHLPVPDSLALFDDEAVQTSFRDGTVTGVGLDSSERAFPPELFVDLYAKARAQGLRLTAHAGEEAPASYIETAVAQLSVSRIDHGIALVQDPELLRAVAASRLMLTVCPMSNVVLRSVDAIEDVPVRRLLDAGVRFSINSDDPAYFGGYCLDNYVAVQEAFSLSMQEWVRIARAGIEGSWCGEDRKTALLRRLEQVGTEWQDKLAGVSPGGLGPLLL